MEFIRRSHAACRLRLALAVVPLLVASTVLAASKGEYREHDAHEHGHGALDIVVEGAKLVVERRIPAVNVVGFEHEPHDDHEREAVRQALLPFKDAASVLVPSPEAMCEVETIEAELFAMEHEEHHEDREPRKGERKVREEDEHEHEHEHEGDGHEGDEHRERGSDADADAHSELHAAYHFRCRAPERLDRIELRAFEHLRDAEEIEARVVTPAMQTAVELRPGRTVVELAP